MTAHVVIAGVTCDWSISLYPAGTSKCEPSTASDEKLDVVVGAFQRDDGAFELWSLTAPLFKHHMRDTRSRSSAGKVGIVGRDLFEAKGKALGKVRL